MGDKGSLRSRSASVSLRTLEHKVDHSPSHMHDCRLLPLAHGRVGKEETWAWKQGLGGITCLRPESVEQVLFAYYQPQF